MKEIQVPPRIFAKQGYFWIYYWAPRLGPTQPGKFERIPTGIPIDIPIPPAPSKWWTVSSHKLSLLNLIKNLKQENSKARRIVIIPYGKNFGIRYYEGFSDNPITIDTGIKYDVKAPNQLLGWWKDSKYKSDLSTKLSEANHNRFAYIEGRPILRRPSLPKTSLDDILEQLNNEVEAENGKLSESYLKSRRGTIKKILQFDPNTTIETITKEWIGKFRRQLEEEGNKPSTIHTHFRNVKALFNFALEKKYITENPARKVRVKLKKGKVVHTPIADEMKLFRYLYHNDIDLFRQLLFQRLIGLRVSDVVRYEVKDIRWADGELDIYNVKMKRWEEPYPITEAVRILLSTLPTTYEPFAFKSRSTDAVRNVLKDSCEAVGITPFATHQLKRNFAREMGAIPSLDHIYNALLHHSANGETELGATRYDGRQVQLMRETLDKAQAHWIEFLKSLPEFTNQKFILAQVA